jgi:hypothetical protein
MGGIAHAAAGWLTAFLELYQDNWTVVIVYSAACEDSVLHQVIPGVSIHQIETHKVDAGFVAPRFEQLNLPVLLERWGIDLYFNPAFTIPAIKTTGFQVAVVHDLVFLDRPEWVSPELQRVFTAATDLAMRRADQVLTVSEFTRDRMKSLASERGWERTNTVELVRPAVSQEHQTKAKEMMTRPGAAMPAGLPEFV